MLDNEATKKQEAYFRQHIADCKVCFAHFNIEKELRQLIKTKINKKLMPSELADEIRLRIINRTT